MIDIYSDELELIRIDTDADFHYLLLRNADNLSMKIGLKTEQLLKLQHLTSIRCEMLGILPSKAQKPILRKISSNGNDDYDFEFWCPMCNAKIKRKGVKEYSPNFCENCGQRLDWSDN